MEQNMGEIDLVYLWVNGSDPKWQAKHNACIGKTEANSDVNCDGRYADNDELKYSLRSVDMYAPHGLTLRTPKSGLWTIRK